MFDKIRKGAGFIAALDQSGGSSPKALRLYGIDESAYAVDGEMFDLIHAMRTRICTSPAFGGDRVIGAILFEMTMDRNIADQPAPQYLWNEKGVVPFLKADQGLAERRDDVQTMKPMPELDALLARANNAGMFGTKMRSVIHSANPAGVAAVVDQQFEVGKRILAAGLVPIIEPEIDIHSATKAEAEVQLKDAIVEGLEGLASGEQIMLKLTLPDVDGFYTSLVEHPKVLKVAALSGGYSRAEANSRLARQPGMVASFSRALTEGLHVGQSDSEFDEQLESAIASIYAASVA